MAKDSNIKALGTTMQAFGMFMSNQEEARGFKLNATEIIREGFRAAARVREVGEQVQSAQRVGFTKGGVDVASGSALEVMADTVAGAEMDALGIERVARLNARELRRAARKQELSGALTLVGAVAGGVVGGPAGAGMGASLGGAVGGSL